MRYRILAPALLALLLALVAFASSAGQPSADATPTAPRPAPAASEPESEPESEPAPAPAEAAPRTLSPDLIYAALVAEVALQRGDYEAAFEHFLRAAELARAPSLAERAVRSALNAKRSAAAQRALDLWTELEPDAPKAHQLAAFLALEAGDRERALASLRRVIELAGVPGQGYLQAAQILGRLADPADRFRTMRALVDMLDAQENADAQFALATLAAAADDDETAMRLAERAAKLRPGWSDPPLFLARLLVGRDRIEQAHAMLDRYLGETPADRELKLMKAQLYMDGEEPEQALAVFDELLEQDPRRADVLFAAAVLALEIGDLDKARDYLEVLQGLGRRPNDVAFLLGQVEEQAGNSDAALAHYEQVRGRNRTSAQVRIASLYAQAGEIARARELLQRLRDQSPDQAVTFFLIEGELLRAQGLDQQALELYDRALAERPAHADLLYARAMLAVAMDEVGMLERDLRRILVDDPDHVDALNALGYTLADRTDRLAAAQAFIERALQLRPDDPAILDSMGWVLYRKGQPEDAEAYLRRAIEQGFDAEIAAHLGEVLWSLGRKDEAREVWGHALDEAPEHEYLLRVLSRFRFSHTDQ